MVEDLKYYMSVFWRRFHYFALVAIVISAAGIAVAMVLPTKYTSQATLLIESAQIPDELAAATVNIDLEQQLQIIEQRLLTRANIIDIADEVRVFQNRNGMFPDQIVASMRANTEFEVASGRDAAPIFSISFSAERPSIAAQVVSAYVTEVLEENAEQRRQSAVGTLEFFESEVERLAVDLTRKSAEILDFQNANLDALPENLQFQLDRQADLRDRISDIRREIASLGQQRERLIIVFNATGGNGNQDLRSPEQRELDSLKDQLAQALTIYSEQNPKIRQLRAQIDAVQRSVDGQSPVTGDNGEAQRATLLDIQLEEIDSRIQTLKREQVSIEEELVDLRKNLEASPSISVALSGLQRDYENLQQQYNLAVQRQSQASTGERIELLAKGERISVISQPIAPREPSSPNRPLIAAGSVAAGILAGLAFVVLLELINRAIRRPKDLVKGLGITPLATLPMMRTPGEVTRRRAVVFSTILVATIGIVGAIYYLHTEVMPLDLLADRAIGTIGL